LQKVCRLLTLPARRVIVDAFGGMPKLSWWMIFGAAVILRFRSRRGSRRDLRPRRSVSLDIFRWARLPSPPFRSSRPSSFKASDPRSCSQQSSARAKAVSSYFRGGRAAYYTRFGFTAKESAPFPSKYAGRHFMALNITQRRIEEALVIFADAFDKVQ
jgi:hypothetical protein